MSPKRYRIGFLIFSVICIMIAGLIGYRWMVQRPENLMSIIPKGVDLSLEKIRHSSIKGGVKEWVLEAESAQYDTASNQAMLKIIRATFYLKNGDEMNLSAEEGFIKTDSKDIQVRGHVVALNQNFRLETEQMRYDGAERNLFADMPVKISGENINLTANKLVFDLTTNRLRFEGNVQGIIREGISFK